MSILDGYDVETCPCLQSASGKKMTWTLAFLVNWLCHSSITRPIIVLYIYI